VVAVFCSIRIAGQQAEAAGVSYMTVRRAEGSAKPPVSADAAAAIQRALERAGVEFIDVGGQPGVRLRK
jgi:hypothetical protein